MIDFSGVAGKISESWKRRRWDGIIRPYGADEVAKLRGRMRVAYSIAEKMSAKLWNLMETRDYVPALGAMTGGQAVQMLNAGLEAIYVSGWQVAADANLAGQTYPDQSLYPSNSVPALVKRINNAFAREDQIASINGVEKECFVPVVADGEAGFGGPLNVFELTKWMIDAGAAAVHFEDQLSSEKKCGHLGGKVLVPTSTFIRNMVSARLAADTMGVDTILIARTDSHSARLITSDVDERDSEFITGSRSPEGFYGYESGMDSVIQRGLDFSPYADMLWFETSRPDLDEATRFAREIHSRFPGKKLAYNCSPSFNWEGSLSSDEISAFQSELGKLGYAFQFITLAGFHALNHSMFRLASEYSRNGMTAYASLQREEFMDQKKGYSAVKHQSFVGTGLFDEVSRVISGNTSSTTALRGSTEEDQFADAGKVQTRPAHS
ncbi:MAG: isocitrate lyase [Thermoplasmataceae archaeon]